MPEKARKERGRAEIDINVSTLKPERMQKSTGKGAFGGVTFGLHTITKIHFIRSEDTQSGKRTAPKRDFFILLTFGEVQKDVGSAV